MVRAFSYLQSDIIDKGLCTRCGGCQASCPVEAISFTKEGMKLTGECIECGNCASICPGGGIDLASYEKRLFGKERRSERRDRLGIHIRKEYLKAGEEEVFKKGYFGGRVSALLIHALDNGTIDAALLTDWSGTEALSIGRGVIARKREEVLSASSSKYLFSPVLNLLRKIKDDRTIGTVALVGLPCHIHAFRKMELHPGTRSLTEKVIVLISLNCGAPNLDEDNWRRIIEKLTDMSGSDISRFSARKVSGANLRFHVEKVDGSTVEKDIPVTTYMRGIGSLGVWPRCLMCPDYSGELSDITFGAPYIRTQRGADLIDSAKGSGALVKAGFKMQMSQVILDLIMPRRKLWHTKKNIQKRKRRGLSYPNYSNDPGKE